MGTKTRVTGGFTITPPLSWAEVQAAPVGLFRDKAVDLGTAIVGVTAGPAGAPTLPTVGTMTLGISIEPASEKPYAAHNLVEHAQAVIDTFARHTFAGRFECQGEYGHPWRVVVTTDEEGVQRAVRVDPTVVWLDDPNENWQDHLTEVIHEESGCDCHSWQSKFTCDAAGVIDALKAGWDS